MEQVPLDHLDCGNQRGRGRMQYAEGALEVQYDNMMKQGRMHGYPVPSGGQGPYLRSLGHLGRSSGGKDR